MNHKDRIGDITNHRARCRILPSTTTNQHRCADHIARHTDAIIDLIHTRDYLALRDQCGVQAHGQFVRLKVARNHREQLNLIAKLASDFDICAGDFTDTFANNLIELHPLTMREVGEDHCLVSCIDPVEVECFIGLNIAELSRIAERRFKTQPFALHACEDVVGRAVEDTENQLKAICHQRLADGLDDRNTTCNRCFVKVVPAIFIRNFEQLFAMLANQCLIRSHHDLTLLQRTSS